MKPILLKLLALLLVVGLVAPVVGAWAARPRATNPTLRREIREYLKTKVLPVLRQQRQKLEPQLAPADQARLATYRTQLKALGQRGRALRRSTRPAGPAQVAAPTPDSAATVRTRRMPWPELQSVRTERREIMRQVVQLALKYQSNIAQLAAEIQPQQAQWAADMQAIVAKDAPAEQQAKLARWRGRGARFGGLRKPMRASLFLLMDPNKEVVPAGNTSGTSLYPNPVAATSQLQYEVKEAGPVTVTLLDKTGTVLRTLLPAAQQEKGAYTQPVDLRDLPSGTYYYQITTRAGTETKRFVKE